MDSKLTQLLEKPLSSRSVCAVICVGREDAHAAESIESLNFGEGLRRLRGDGEARGGAGAAISAALRAIDARAAELQRLIAAKALGVIVGAEAENRELEALLDQRRALLGES
ncbi:hypothetical protein JL722_12959 [Aureococcus anophagefferens]|nr:hypothetical protein JL722_12959 [Aureococcus anophagefferens]